MDLKIIAQEIRDEIKKYQEEHSLSFVEDTHTYFIKDENGNITSDMPSVSTVLKSFYTEFDATTTRTFKNCGGDPEKEKQLLNEWAATGEYATNMGSRVHFLLEKYLVDLYGSYKEVRQPIFKCDEEQTNRGDKMIIGGKHFIKMMHERGAVLLDTEMVLGNRELGYFGQPDKVWLIKTSEDSFGIVITDWKSNKIKNFEVQHYTKKMLPPFENLHDNALGHYFVQLPLYGKLLLKMLQGTKFENTPILGAIVTLLKDDGTFQEFRVPKEVYNTIFEMNVKKYLKK
jgi:hypothetical protein